MENQKASVEEAENILKDAGLTVAQFVQLLGKKNSSVLKLSNEQQKQFQILYDEIDSDCLDKEQKGKKLEDNEEELDTSETLTQSDIDLFKYYIPEND